MLAFLLGLVVGVVGTALIYKNNKKKFEVIVNKSVDAAKEKVDDLKETTNKLK